MRQLPMALVVVLAPLSCRRAPAMTHTVSIVESGPTMSASGALR